MYIIGGVLLALMSLWLINLITSLSVTTLWSKLNQWTDAWNGLDCTKFKWSDLGNAWSSDLDPINRDATKSDPSTWDWSKIDPTIVLPALAKNDICAVSKVLSYADPTVWWPKIDPTIASNWDRASKLDFTNSPTRKNEMNSIKKGLGDLLFR